MFIDWILALDWGAVGLGISVWAALCYFSALGVDYIRTHYYEYSDDGFFSLRYFPQAFSRRDWIWIPFGPIALLLLMLANLLSEH